MKPDEIRFAQSIWLVVLLVMIPVMILLLRRFARTRLVALRAFASDHLLPELTANVSPRLRALKQGLFVLGVSLCVLALARPLVGWHWEEARRRGIDILFAVDTSRSMLAQDVNPDRLSRAKLAVLDLVAKLDGDRVGLLAFAGTAFLQCPLTLDADAFRQSLEALDSAIIPQGGTNIASAIQESEAAFSLGNVNHKILVILTDGEDLEANGIAAAKAAAQRDVRIFTVGVGTTSGELIPVRNADGGVDFLKNEKGQVVKSRLDDATLRQIAEATGGFYEPLGQGGQGLEMIYNRGLASIPKQELSSRRNRIYIERFQWPLALGILCLMSEMLLRDRRRAGARLAWRIPGRATASSLLIMGLAPWSFSIAAASPQSAERAYQQGKFNEALSQYAAESEKKPKKVELQYNLGAASYKTDRFPEAAEAFQKALRTDDIPLQQQTFYNLGNTQYRLGQQTEKTKPEQTIQAWEQSLSSYEQAMKLKPDDADAKFNYEFVKKKLQELLKQQPPEPKEKDPQENKGDQDQQKQETGSPEQQAKNEGDPKNQKGGGSEAKDQQKNQPPEGGPKDDPKQNGEKPKPDQAPPKPDRPEPQKGAGAPRHPNKPDSRPSEHEPQPLPGQLSREEAKNLLDSLKGDEKKMPVSSSQPQPNAPREDLPKRDW